MARPKKDIDNPAIERISAAYWKLLEEEGFQNITIKRLSLEAGVNHKTIYYHFTNMEDMAEKLFYDYVEKALGGDNPWTHIMSREMTTDDFINNAELLRSASKIILYARDDSAFLNDIFRNYMLQNWLSMLGISENDLTPEDRMDLDFIISGAIYTIAMNHTPDKLHMIPKIMDRELGKGIIGTFERITSMH